MDVSNHLEESVQFTKNLSNPSGTFSFNLNNSRDWKDIIKPGMWCLIYMCNDGGMALPKHTDQDLAETTIQELKTYSKYLRGICKIDQIQVNGSVDEGLGAFNASFFVSGRDFGIIYEDTDMWVEGYQQERLINKAITQYLSWGLKLGISGLLYQVHDLVYAPHKIVSQLSQKTFQDARGNTFRNAINRAGLQWLLPKALVDILELKRATDPGTQPTNYWGDFEVTKFYTTVGKVPFTSWLGFLEGSPWEKLKEISIPYVHELFTELVDGKPKLVFRPVPWALNARDPEFSELKPLSNKYILQRIKGQKNLEVQFKYQEEQAPFYYLDLVNKDSLYISPEQVRNFSVGENEQNRYNHFLAIPKQQVFSENTAPFRALIEVSKRYGKFKGDDIWPRLNRESIARNGFKKLHLFFKMNLIPKGKFLDIGDETSARAGRHILAYNAYLKNIWENAIFSETGTCDVVGRNDTRVGKAAIFNDEIGSKHFTPYLSGKMFYVEGYTDTFTIGDQPGANEWNQTLVLTRGFDTTKLDRMFRGEKPELVKRDKEGPYKKSGTYTPTRKKR